MPDSGQIQMAEFLLALGLTTIDAVMAVFKSDGHDDEQLAVVRADLERRIARRG